MCFVSPCRSQLSEYLGWPEQERVFLRNFKLYANSIGARQLNLPHRNVTSWAWYNSYGSPMSALYPQLRNGSTVDWAAISALTQVPNRFVR